MTEPEVQRAERWRREREIDEVAISLGLAHNTPQHGICYWPPSNKESFRKGYEAGVAKPRSSLEQLQWVQVRGTPELLAALKEAAKTPGPLMQIQDETTPALVTHQTSPQPLDRADVIRLAREAGIANESMGSYRFQSLFRFAALVAAAEREACVQLLVDMKAKSRNSLFRSALTCAEGAIEARGKEVDHGACRRDPASS